MKGDEELTQFKAVLFRGHFLSNEKSIRVQQMLCLIRWFGNSWSLFYPIHYSLQRISSRMKNNKVYAKPKHSIEPKYGSIISIRWSRSRSANVAHVNSTVPELETNDKMPENPFEYLRSNFKGLLQDEKIALIVQDEHCRFPSR